MCLVQFTNSKGDYSVTSKILEQANAIKDYIVACKRHIHQHPELSMHETATTAFVKAELQGMGVELLPVDGPVGVLGMIKGERSDGPVIGIRADMDALPIQELTCLPDQSTVPNVMHACGHDCHTAMLLGAAKLLLGLKSQFHAVKLIFQPAEEVGGGALYMIKCGCLEGVDVLLGLHGIGSPTGTLNFLPGSAMASADLFNVTVRGTAGHGAYPHRSGADPLLAAATCVTALQGMVTRQLDAISPTIVSVCTIHGGAAKNAIPDHVEFGGTVRCQSAAVRSGMEARIKKTVESIAAGFNCTCELDYQYGCPNLVNDPEVTAICRKAAEQTVGMSSVATIPYPAMGSEDYAFYVQKLGRSCFARLGVARPGQPVSMGMGHSGHYVFDENALPVGSAYFAAAVLELNRQ